MNKLIPEDILDDLLNEVIKPFKITCEPLENQLIYISTADMHDNPFDKMVREYLKEKTK